MTSWRELEEGECFAEAGRSFDRRQVYGGPLLTYTKDDEMGEILKYAYKMIAYAGTKESQEKSSENKYQMVIHLPTQRLKCTAATAVKAWVGRGTSIAEDAHHIRSQDTLIAFVSCASHSPGRTRKTTMQAKCAGVLEPFATPLPKHTLA